MDTVWIEGLEGLRHLKDSVFFRYSSTFHQPVDYQKRRSFKIEREPSFFTSFWQSYVGIITIVLVVKSFQGYNALIMNL